MSAAGSIDPRGDLSSVNQENVECHISNIQKILGWDADEFAIAEALRIYVRNYLRPDPETWIVVNDELALRKIISKAQFRNFLSLVLEI